MLSAWDPAIFKPKAKVPLDSAFEVEGDGLYTQVKSPCLSSLFYKWERYMPQGKARSQNVKSENSIKILNQGCISE